MFDDIPASDRPLGPTTISSTVVSKYSSYFNYYILWCKQPPLIIHIDAYHYLNGFKKELNNDNLTQVGSLSVEQQFLPSEPCRVD